VPARQRNLFDGPGRQLYHMGFGEPVRRSTLADANESRMGASGRTSHSAY